MAKARTQTHSGSGSGGSPTDISRRRFVTDAAVLGAAAGSLGLGISAVTGFAATGELMRAGA